MVASARCVPDTSSRQTAATAPFDSNSEFRCWVTGRFSDSITIYFRADVRAAAGRSQPERDLRLRAPPAGVLPLLEGRPMPGFLVVNTAIDADGNRSTDLWTDTLRGALHGFVREALGAPDLPIEIENVQRWNACAEWAAQLRHERVFVAGDAAHDMPPTGGFGGNTGVQDGHNLAWKLALVLGGTAGPELLFDL